MLKKLKQKMTEAKNWVQDKAKKAWVWTKERWRKILVALGIGVAIASGGLIYQNLNQIPDQLKLKCDKGNILYDFTVNETRCDDTTNQCVDLGAIKEYMCVSNVERPAEQGEDLSLRTKNAQFFYNGKSKGKDQWTAKFFSGDAFYKDETQNKWYETQVATTTIDAFDAQMTLSFWESLLGQRVLADSTSSYAGAGDGETYNSYASSTWNFLHNDASSTSVYPTNDSIRIATGRPSNWGEISRGFFPIDTSSLPDNAVISGATLYLSDPTGVTNNDNDGYDFVVVVGPTTQAATNTLVTADYDDCGTTHTPTEGSNRIDITTMVSTTTAYQGVFTLNATGISWISTSSAAWTMLGMREGHDVLDHEAVAGNRFRPASSERVGTNIDPYLSITYTVPAGAEEETQIIIIE